MEKKNKVSIKELSITQSNPLVEATYPRTIQKSDGTEVDIDLKVTTRAHKVSRLIVSLINPDDEDLRLYRIDISTLKQYLGYKMDFPNGKFYQDLKEIAIRLNKQPIEIRPEPKRIITAFFISSYELNFKTGEAIFEISGQLKPFLLQLKNNFTSFHLNNIPKLSSGYSIRLYELLYQYKNIGKRIFDDIDRLQQMLGSSYDKYSHFKMRVLEPAKKDISQRTNISYEYQEVKTGKKITKLVFYIKENVPVADYVEDQLSLTFTQTQVINDNNKENGLSGILRSMGINAEKVNEYVQMGFTIIKEEKKRIEAMERCRDIDTYYNEKLTLLRASKAGMDNPAGFLIKALQEDWQTSKASKEIENQRLLKEHREKENKIKQLEKQYEQAQKQYNEMQKPIYEKLTNDSQIFNAAYEAVIKEYGQGTIFHKMITEHATPQLAYKNSPALNSIMNTFLFKNHPAEFAETKDAANAVEALRIELNTLKNGKK